MLYLLGIISSPSTQDMSLATRELIHEVVVLSEEYNLNPVVPLSIIKCESGFNSEAEHLNKNGTRDFGLFQLNSTHIREAESEGLDIKNPKDNLKYGMELLSREGVIPWTPSKLCWLGSVNNVT